MDNITVDRLFRATQVVKLGEQCITVHALSDLELQERHRRALEASMRLARHLRDTATGEYLAHLEPVETAGRDVHQAVCISAKRRELYDDAAKEIPFRHIPFPDGATSEEQGAVLEQRETAEKKLAEDREKFVTDKLASYTTALEALADDKLKAEALKLTFELTRSAAYSDEFVAQTVLLGTETQDGHPLLTSIEQARKLSREAMNTLYMAQEAVTNLDPLGLKSRSSTA